MTDARSRPPRVVARSHRPAYVAYGGAAVGFVAVLGVLGWQVATGADPAIGEAEPVAAAPAQRVVVLRIVRRVIVTPDAPERAAPPAAPPSEQSAAPAAPAPAQPAAPAPTPAQPAAPAAAPAQPAAPAPAPAPAAPPTTRAS
jgi:hypothetical protein